MRRLTILAFSLSLLFGNSLKAQYLRAKVGLDIPMQYLVGLNYQQGKHISAEMSLGYVGIPFNGDLYRVINVPEKHENRKTYLIETTDDGFVWGMGLNGHYKKWYGGVFFQRLELHASATYDYILGSGLFQEELNESQQTLLNAFLEVGELGALSNEVNLSDVMRLNMVSWQGGLKVGRRFYFKNPRWEFRAELALSRNFAVEVESDYDKELFDEVIFYFNILKNNKQLREQIEEQYNIDIDENEDIEKLLDFNTREKDMEDWWHQYGYIPTLNFHLTYLLFVPNKVKEQQEKLDQMKTE